ncbi:hypothetical protein HK107_01340 [Parvularcula sp. ZS-1/3]|uniref:Uncharacterized protein n=1 Tax=Parvularcula mediterranea TaxID=2732508 RepID=A0A7Y3RK19_9PROT|nr:hypothetical protein [Parvularcula mediterranea]NNU14966.1 hypothetical protein [Parvularcula mediterranea]
MSDQENQTDTAKFSKPVALAKGAPRVGSEQVALLDVEAERSERQLKTERLKKLRLEAEAQAS